MLDQKRADMLLEIGDISCVYGICRHAMHDNDEDLEGRLDELSNDGFDWVFSAGRVLVLLGGGYIPATCRIQPDLNAPTGIRGEEVSCWSRERQE